MSNDLTVTMYIPCRDCGQLRTLRLRPAPDSLRHAFDSRCRNCYIRTTRAPRHAIDTAQQLAAEIAWMREPPETAARRLGTTVAALSRRFYRAGLTDAAHPFMVAEYAARKQRKTAA